MRRLLETTDGFSTLSGDVRLRWVRFESDDGLTSATSWRLDLRRFGWGEPELCCGEGLDDLHAEEALEEWLEWFNVSE